MERWMIRSGSNGHTCWFGILDIDLNFFNWSKSGYASGSSTFSPEAFCSSGIDSVLGGFARMARSLVVNLAQLQCPKVGPLVRYVGTYILMDDSSLSIKMISGRMTSCTQAFIAIVRPQASSPYVTTVPTCFHISHMYFINAIALRSCWSLGALMWHHSLTSSNCSAEKGMLERFGGQLSK